MKAMVYTRYGPPDVLELREVDKPILDDDGVLVKVHAASVTFGDAAVVRGEPLLSRLWSGFLAPKYTIPGKDMAGRVEAVGRNVNQFQPGDEVYGDLSVCGWGAYAEYAAVPESAIALKPDNLTFEEAAAVPESAVVALQGLRDQGKIQPGLKVLINGASGGVGTFAVQIAKAFETEVTAVCSTGKLELLQSLGADQVIDYTQEDFTGGEKRYDLILGANGYHSILDYRRALTPKGRYVCTGGTTAQIFQAMLLGPLISIGGSKKMSSLGLVKQNQGDLAFMKELIEDGKVAPVVDRTYPLSEVPEALCYVGEGHARGKVIISIAQESQ